MTTATLRTYTCKDLAQMAKKEGVTGWHAMRKEELIHALSNAARRTKRRQSRSSKKSDLTAKTNGHAAQAPPLTTAQRRAKARIEALRTRLTALKNIATDEQQTTQETSKRDRLVLMVRDAYWLQAHWEIGQKSVARARTALGQSWHAASPVLRILKLGDDGSSTLYREIEIHGGVDHWYIDVADPPCNYRAELGYRAGDESYYCLCRSSTVTTPTPGSTDAGQSNWGDVADNADRI
ncbi:MAG: DUF4912 domain-containing protein, partial [Aeoliella sp.]